MRIFAVVGVFTILAACASAPKEEAPAAAAFSFAVIGDIPYNDEDRAVLKDDIVPVILEGDTPFVIHLGDYKSGGAPCTAQEDEAMLGLIESLSPKTVFYTPGDNEWTDCDRFVDPETGEPMSELARLDRLRSLFFSDPASGPEEMRVKAHPHTRENKTWDYGGVRFATIHVVGTGNGRRAVMGDDPQAAAARADRRENAAVNWIRLAGYAAEIEKADALVFTVHADMSDVEEGVRGVPCEGASASRDQLCDAFVNLRKEVRKAAVRFGGPTLLIHGDTAPFTLAQSFAGDEAENLWVLNAAGDHGVTGEGFHYGVQDSTLVTVTPGAENPFSASGLATMARPGSH